jgi:hypothetical protein
MEAAWLPNGAPFVNRAQLRKGVRDLLRPGGSRILVVNGPPGSGKSYSAEFIRSVQQATGQFRLAVVRNDPASEPYFGPAELADEIATRLGVDPRPGPGEIGHPEFNNRRLVAWLTAAAQAGGEPWCWALDGFSTAGRPDIMDFIRQLIDSVVDGSNVQLVLLGYDEPLSPRAAAVAVREDISPLSEADVRDFLARTARASPGVAAEGPAAAAEESIEQSVRTIFTDLPEGKQRNVALGVRVLRASAQFGR